MFTVFTTIVTRMPIENFHVRRIGEKSTFSRGRHSTMRKRPTTSTDALTTCCHARLQ